jgi:hypothetical protein
MLSWPATGITRMLVTRGEDGPAPEKSLGLCTTRVSQTGFAYRQSGDCAGDQSPAYPETEPFRNL